MALFTRLAFVDQDDAIHAHAKAHVDLAAAGTMVFIEAGRLAGLDAASGEIAWITTRE